MKVIYNFKKRNSNCEVAWGEPLHFVNFVAFGSRLVAEKKNNKFLTWEQVLLRASHRKNMQNWIENQIRVSGTEKDIVYILKNFKLFMYL